MLKIQYTNNFEKEIKKAQKRGHDLSKLKEVISHLVAGKPLPSKYRDHPLREEEILQDGVNAISNLIG